MAPEFPLDVPGLEEYTHNEAALAEQQLMAVLHREENTHDQEHRALFSLEQQRLVISYLDRVRELIMSSPELDEQQRNDRLNNVTRIITQACEDVANGRDVDHAPYSLEPGAALLSVYTRMVGLLELETPDTAVGVGQLARSQNLLTLAGGEGGILTSPSNFIGVAEGDWATLALPNEDHPAFADQEIINQLSQAREVMLDKSYDGLHSPSDLDDLVSRSFPGLVYRFEEKMYVYPEA